MEAKDTVVEGNRLLIYNAIVKCVEGGRALEWLKEPMSSLLAAISSAVGEIMDTEEAQAEISFKAGIREVVGWNKHNVKQYFDIEVYIAKLNEWGIE